MILPVNIFCPFRFYVGDYVILLSDCFYVTNATVFRIYQVREVHIYLLGTVLDQTICWITMFSWSGSW